MTQSPMFRDTANTERDSAIQASSFGGLNTMASPLNMPYTDSPELVNVDTTLGGNVKKRPGTRLIGELEVSSDGTSLTSVTTNSGLDFMVMKVGTSLYVYEVIDDQMYNRMQFHNVWNQDAEPSRPSIVATGEAEQRLLLFTGRNAPVQLKFVENATQVHTSATSVVVDEPLKRFVHATPGADFRCYINNTIVDDASKFNYSNEQLTLSGVSLEPGDVVIFVYVCWQWWAEAEIYDADRFYNSANRFNVDRSDLHVPVPERLRDDAELDTYGLYRIYAAYGSDGGVSNYFTRLDNPFWYSPETSRPGWYTTTNGTASTGDERDKPLVGSNFVTFGGLYTQANNPGLYDAEGNFETFAVHLLRPRKMLLNNGRGIPLQHLLVQYSDYENETTLNQVYNVQDTADKYGYILFDGNNWVDPIPFQSQLSPTVGTTPNLEHEIPEALEATFTGYATHIMFDRGQQRGLPLQSVVRLINKETRHIGSAASASLNPYYSGAFVPVYGLGRFADYDSGYFPTAAGIYQNRLVLGGIPTAPMKLVFSSISDYTYPGERYAGFFIDAYTDTVSDAFDFDLKGTAADRIVALLPHAGSLFALTTEACHRIFANGPIQQASVVTQFVGSVGALNNQCYVNPVDQAIFLSEEGVYRIVPSDGLDDSYSLTELSAKIRDEFDNLNRRDAEQYAALGYDQEERKLYVVIPDSKSLSFATKLYVMQLTQAAWTQYETIGRFKLLGSTSYRDLNGIQRWAFASRVGDVAVAVSRTEYNRFMDITKVRVGHQYIQTLLAPKTTTTTLANVRRYPHDILTTGFEDVEDLEVSLDGEVLTFQDDWYKQGRSTVYLVESPKAGQTLTVRHKNPENGCYVQVYKDNLPLEPGEGYTVDYDTGIVTLTTYDAESTYEVGVRYLATYRSPVFSWGVLSQFKRLFHWSGLFSNEASMDTYSVDEVSEDDAVRLVGKSKNPNDANLTFIYSNESSGESSMDIYRLGDLLWDINTFDQYGSPYGDEKYVQIKEPLQGIGYAVQVVVWSWDENTFELAGYQIDGTRKGKRYIHA